MEGAYTITKITDDQERDHYSTSDIVSQFQQVYTDIYTSQTSAPPADLVDYLSNIAIAWLSDDHREYLCQPITEEDIKTAIKSLPNKKAPGPDGLTCEFYKEFAHGLTPYLLEMYAEAYEVGSLLPNA